jgi:hypothetical protein
VRFGTVPQRSEKMEKALARARSESVGLLACFDLNVGSDQSPGDYIRLVSSVSPLPVLTDGFRGIHDIPSIIAKF